MNKKSLGKLIVNAVAMGIAAVIISGCGAGTKEADRVVLKQGALEFCVDMNGKIQGRSDYKEVKALCESIGVEDYPDSLKFEEDGVFFYSASSEDADKTYILAHDSKKNKLEIAAELDGSKHISCIDYYDGYYYVSGYEFIGESYRTFSKTFSKKGRLKFAEAENKSLKAFYEAASQYEELLNQESSECIERTLQENGFVLARNDDTYYKLTADGKSSKIQGFNEEDVLSVVSYDDKNVYYYIHDLSEEQEEGEHFYALDLEKGSSTELPTLQKSCHTADYQDGKLFYECSAEGDGDHNKNSLCSYDVATGEEKTYLTREEYPAAGDYYVFCDYTIKGNKLFFVDFKNAEIGWYIASLDDVDNTQTLLDVEPIVVNAYKYGTVKRQHSRAICPYCDEMIHEVYADTFDLDASFSEHAAEINKTLTDLTNKRLQVSEIVRKQYEPASEDACKRHNNLWSTDNYDLKDVRIEDGNMLCVEESDPRREKITLIFDLQTGKLTNESEIPDAFSNTCFMPYEAPEASETSEVMAEAEQDQNENSVVYDASEIKFEVKKPSYEYDCDGTVYLDYAPNESWNIEHVFCVNSEGAITGKYSKQDILKILDDNDSYFEPIKFLMEKDGVLYYECWESREYSDVRATFAIDPVNCNIKKLFEFPENALIDTFDYYNGYIYSAVSVSGEKADTFTVYKITKDKDKFEYTVEQDNTLSAFYKALEELDPSTTGKSSRRPETKYSKECYERTLGENGFVIREKGDAYYFVYADGKYSKIELPIITEVYVPTYDSQFVFFETLHSSGDPRGLYCYEIESKQTARIPLEADGLRYEVVYQDGIVYYKTADDYDSETATVTLYSYNMETGETKALATRQDDLNAGNGYKPFYNYFVENGKLFFEDYKDKKVNWYFADINDIDKTQTLLDFASVVAAFEEKDTEKYGKIELFNAEGYCPHCKELMSTAEVENFALDPSYSKYADKINKALMEHTNKELEACKNSTANMDNTGCGNHELSMMKTYDTIKVEEVNILEGRYLVVSEKEDYHNTDAPSDFYQKNYIFDLQTGDELNIMNFYKGTEDEFKALIATKVKESFKKRMDEDNEIFTSEDEQKAYNEAVEHYKPEAVYFGEKGIKCYYDHYDFSMCPYNVDLYRVFVSYKDLLGRDTLTPPF